jgi:hypothetical protein
MWLARESVAITPSDDWYEFVQFGAEQRRPSILTDITYGNPHS